MTFLKRLIPKTLLGRLTALLLLALAVSNAVGVMGFLAERHHALLTVGIDQVATRTIATLRLLERAPTELHNDILSATGDRRLRSTINPTPILAVKKSLNDIERELLGRLAQSLDVELSESIRLRADWQRRWDRRGGHDDDDDDDDHYKDRDDDDDGWKNRKHRPWRGYRVQMSVPMADGQWLNVQTGFADRPFDWRGPTQVSALLMALAIIAVLWIFLRRAMRPVGAMADAAERLGRGERLLALAETGPEDIRRTVRAFNAMSARIERFVRDRTELLAAISHDLRTPITTLRLRAAFIEDEEIKARMEATLDELQAMVEALLTYARTEAEQEETVSVDAVSMIQRLVDEVIETEGVDANQVTVTAPDTLALRVRPLSLKRCVRNLIQNAVRYGGGATVSLFETKDDSIIRIEDDGPGIPDDRIADMMQPFVRMEESRSKDTGGIGLGLSIARGIARAHGGDLLLSNRPEGGLRADVVLPKPRATA